MKLSGKIVGTIIIVICIIAAIVLLSHKSAPQKQTIAVPTPTVTPTSTVAPSPIVTTKQYSAEEKAQIRTKFIDACVSVLGSQKTSVCTCAADRLRDQYTDEQLTTLYDQFSASKQIPASVKSAVTSCSSK